MDATAGDALDPTMIQQLRDLDDGRGAILREVVDVFLADAPARLVALRRHLAAGDLKALRETAHALKGAAGNLGLLAVQAACAELERHARSGALATCAPAVAEVERASAAGEALLRALR